MNPPISNWSFSALQDYETCPYRIYLKRVEKAEQPNYDDDPAHPLTRGTRIHEEAEAFIRGAGPMTRDLKKIETTLEELRDKFASGLVVVEELWRFDKEWNPVDNWDDAWCIVKSDVTDHGQGPSIIEVTDWKTGKSFGNEVKHTQQLQLYAVAGFMKQPEAIAVIARLLYVDEGKTKERKYMRTALPMLLDGWHKRGEKLTNAIQFPAKANTMSCRWCPYGTQNGTGACAFAALPNR